MEISHAQFLSLTFQIWSYIASEQKDNLKAIYIETGLLMAVTKAELNKYDFALEAHSWLCRTFIIIQILLSSEESEVSLRD